MKRKITLNTLFLLAALPFGALAADPQSAAGGLPSAEMSAPAGGKVEASPLFNQLDANHDGYVSPEEAKRSAEVLARSEYYEKQIGEVISGVVQAVNMTQGVTVGLDMKAEGIMPPNQKIPGERFKIHDRVRAIILEVKDSPRGPQIILSRSHRNFLRRLLENEVPEIYHGIVEIRSIAREPGQRAKVAVSASQPNVDPVGACVGMKGVRIQTIVKELHDEKIDIIEWNVDPVLYISKAISPAKVSGVYLDEVEKIATVVVQEDQLSLAIGRDGQNARLAAKLVGWKIDIKSLTEAATDAVAKVKNDPSLTDIAKAEKDSVPAMEEVLQKKSEGRPLTPEEYHSMSQFVERVERHTVEQKRVEAAAEEEKISSARREVPEVAFTTELVFLGLPEKIQTILGGAEFRNVGDLMMTMKLTPDRILGLSGIGPKAMQTIEKNLEVVKFPEPEKPPEVIEPTPEVTVEIPSEAQPEQAPEATAIEETGEKHEAPEGEAEVEEKDFEKLFSLQNVLATPPVNADENEEGGDKKKGKKKKKDRELEFDEKRGEVVAKKIHKRDDEVEAWE